MSTRTLLAMSSSAAVALLASVIALAEPPVPNPEQSKQVREAFANMGLEYEPFTYLKTNQTAHIFRFPETSDDATLKGLPNPPFAFGLNLTVTKVTDKGLKALAPLENLIYLNLSGTKVTDEGLKARARLKTTPLSTCSLRR